MDSLLRMETLESAEMIAYADDLLVLVAGGTRAEIMTKTERILEGIVERGREPRTEFLKRKIRDGSP